MAAGGRESPPRLHAIPGRHLTHLPHPQAIPHPPRPAGLERRTKTCARRAQAEYLRACDPATTEWAATMPIGQGTAATGAGKAWTPDFGTGDQISAHPRQPMTYPRAYRPGNPLRPTQQGSRLPR
jgi:hypothetical protein